MINKWSPYLEELINYAANLWGRCEKSLKGIKGTPSSLIYLYYHIIQMADGIHVLCSKACFTTAIPSLRSLWEALISIEYMLQRDFEARSTAWLACCHLDARGYLEQQDMSSEKWNNFSKLKDQDRNLGCLNIAERNQPLIRSQIRAYNEVLSKPKFASVLKSMTKEAVKRGKWYAVNSGPTSICGMAEQLGRPLEYKLLYSNYSGLSHAKDTSRMIRSDGTQLYLEPIRSMQRAEEIYGLASGYLTKSALLVAGKLRPDERIREQLEKIILRHRPELADKK